jgi:hypothetical protein
MMGGVTHGAKLTARPCASRVPALRACPSYNRSLFAALCCASHRRFQTTLTP